MPTGTKPEREKASNEPKKGRLRQALKDMNEEDAFELRGEAGDGQPQEDDAEVGTLAHAESFLRVERRTMRRKYLLFGAILLAVVCFSLCLSHNFYFRMYSPVDVAACYGSWFQLTFTRLTNPTAYAQAAAAVMQGLPMYQDVIYGVEETFKYIVCGILLAISGMLYQNTFRNPIAAPSMLGVTNGVNLAILILVIQYGSQVLQDVSVYYLYAYIGGAAILAVVILGGWWTSGKGRFNVVNMLLIGTIISQLLSTIITYAQNWLTTDQYNAIYQLQTMAGLENGWTWVTLSVGLLVSIVPVIVFRFRLNLVSFDDMETRVLGVNPNRLRILALLCGSIMILTASVNAGQVAMASLVIPFIVRGVFGVEFRKQLMGNVLLGSILLLVCGDFVSAVYIHGMSLDLGSVVTVLALPLFVWILAAGQRSWE